MKRLTALCICLICCHSSFGQNNAADPAYRMLTVGIRYRPVRLSGLNQLLDLGRYPAINTEWTVLSISRDVEWTRAPEWSAWLNFSLSNQRQRKEEPRSADASLFQFSAGLGLRVWKNERISLITQTGIDITSLTVRCFDQLIDTTNVAGYISAPESDIKQIVCSQPSLRTGLMLRWMGKEGTVLKVSSGYNIPLQATTVSHYRGDFGDLRATRLGGFYIGAEFGFARKRCMD